MKKTFVILSIFVGFSCQAQNAETKSKLWGVSIEGGINSNSHSSVYAKLSPNYSIGVIRSFKSKGKMEHAIHTKFNILNKYLGNVPYPILNSSNNTVVERVKQKTTSPLIFLGWRFNRELTESIFITSGIGFNYNLKSKFTARTSKGKSTTTLPSTGLNYFFTNPEIHFGVGIKLDFNKVDLHIIPKYRLNVGSRSAAAGNGIGNSPYLVHSVGIESIIKF